MNLTVTVCSKKFSKFKNRQKSIKRGRDLAKGLMIKTAVILQGDNRRTQKKVFWGAGNIMSTVP